MKCVVSPTRTSEDIVGPAVFPRLRSIRLRHRSHHHGGRRLPNRLIVSGVPSAAAAKPGLPVNLLCWGHAGQRAAAHPATPRDGHRYRPSRPAAACSPAGPADVWADLPKLLALAQYENVRVKISDTCTMSHQPFPYDNIWEPVLRAIDAFGLDRCMWETIGMLTYEQGVTPFRDTKRLSENDRAALMGGTLQKIYKW